MMNVSSLLSVESQPFDFNSSRANVAIVRYDPYVETEDPLYASFDQSKTEEPSYKQKYKTEVRIRMMF